MLLSSDKTVCLLLGHPDQETGARSDWWGPEKVPGSLLSTGGPG